MLRQRILTEGKVLPGQILKVDGFLNHNVDVVLTDEMGREFHRLFYGKPVTKVLTIEASGIPVAYATARAFGVPLLFAKKARSSNIDDSVYTSLIHSYTYNTAYRLTVSKQYLQKDDSVLVIDDFLANGQALSGLFDIVDQAGAKLIGAGVVIEKGFQDGGRELRRRGFDIKALVTIERFDGDCAVLKTE
jgi:xanthine phosphoribosyltransferase